MNRCPKASNSTAIPADPDAQPEPPLGQQVDLGGLLGHQDRLPLRQDHDRADELQRRQRRDEPEQHQDLVECGLDRVGPIPAGVNPRIGADHMIEHGDMPVAELSHRLHPGAYCAGVAPELGLRKHGTDL